MIEKDEIIASLSPLNGKYFDIADLEKYAEKAIGQGKSIVLRGEKSNEPISYVLYYDNGPDIFVTMVWTHAEHRRRGYAAQLLRQLIVDSTKDVRLEVHKNSPAQQLYRNLGFEPTKTKGDHIAMSLRKTIAIMQPYVFPYIGYFHLLNSSHLFVFYDDVNFVKKGWINRNRILLNGTDHLFTVPLTNASQNNSINETMLAINAEWARKFKKTLHQAYSRAPYFSPVMNLVDSLLAANHRNVSELAIASIVSVCDYLDMEFSFTRSSVCSPDTRGLDKADRLIRIARDEGFSRYANAAGGIDLYSKDYFSRHGVQLIFVESAPVEYKQFDHDFVDGLSIIDVLMFNDAGTCRNLCGRYTLN